MTLTISLVLMVLAIVLLVLAGIGVPAGRFSLLAFGLAAWATAVTLSGR